MIRLIFLPVLSLLSGIAFSQTTKPVTQSTTKPSASKSPTTQSIFKDLRDSASYTAGIHIVNKYRSFGLGNFNSNIVSRACNDLQTGKLKFADGNHFDIKTVPDSIAPGVLLKDARDSLSYAAGVYLVNFFHQFDITNFNSAIIARAVNDMQAKKPQLIRDSLANMVALRYQQKLQLVKNKANIDAGQKFLAENKKRPEVKVTRSGLQYEIITQGIGPKPTLKDKVSCHYTGAFIDGTEFNNSYTMGGPITFAVSQVVAGWTEGLQMMPIGSKWKLYIPYTLGYGPGQYNTIPGGSALIFEIELLGIVDQ